MPGSETYCEYSQTVQYILIFVCLLFNGFLGYFTKLSTRISSPLYPKLPKDAITGELFDVAFNPQILGMHTVNESL